MNRSPLGRDGREAPVRVLQLGIDMSKTACIQTATQCPLLSFDSLLRSTPLPSLPRCARASLEARPRSASCVTAQREREAERASVSIVCNGLPRLFLLVCFACPHLPRSVCAALDRRPRLFCRLRYSRKRERDGTPLGVTSMVLTAACVTTDTGRGEDSPARAAHGFDAVGMGGALCCRRR